MRHLISIDDLSDDDLNGLVAAGVRYARGRTGDRPLADAVAGVYFTKTSTRTRTAFSAAALRLGARIIAYGPGDLQTNTGESWADTGQVLSRMLDLLVARTAGDPAELRAWARQDRMSVVNAMTADEHPTQAIADLVTLAGRFGGIEGRRLLYVGEGNNTAAALALALSRFSGARLELRTPPGYGLTEDIRSRAEDSAARHGASVIERHDMDDLPKDVEVIYTTRWQTTGTSKPDPNWLDVFAPFAVHQGLWRDSPKAAFMHDLPAHRGQEVTAEVLDGPAAIAFDQAENKLYGAMAVLAWCAAAST